MDRRDFLKATGLGSLGLMSLPALNDLLAKPAYAADTRESSFYIVAVSHANTVDKVAHTAVVAGSGTFTPGRIEGGGPFLHFDGAAAPGANVIAAGMWTAKRLANYAPLGVAGPFTAGILELDVDLNREIPSPAVIPAKLKIVCNLGPVNLLTGQPEGFAIAIPGSPFVSGQPGGPFVQLHPEVGLTAFSPGRAEAIAFEPAWEQEYQRAHGKAPTPQDRADRIWSLRLALQGEPPSDAQWVSHARELASWRADF